MPGSPRRPRRPLRAGRAAEVVARITSFDAGRDPERLARKYAAIAADPFAFLRGTCHLFYGDWRANPPDECLDAAPRGWICGDLHLENFGTFRGDNGLTYFDINDFDEAALGPATWDLARLTTSLLVAAFGLDMADDEALAALSVYLHAYRAALAEGKARWVERTTARGSVRRLLQQVERRSRSELLDARTEAGSHGRRIRIDGQHALPASDADRELVTSGLVRWTRHEEHPRFFEVLDVARRVAGTGSLGVPRFVVLVRGDGGRKGNVLLDVKAARPSVTAAQATRIGVAQPVWPDEAARVIGVQERAQAASPALLRPIRLGDDAYVLRALQPLEDRLRYTSWKGRPRRMARALETMGHVSAWAVLRSASREGASTLDEWVAWAGGASTTVRAAEHPTLAWERAVIEHARRYRDAVISDWREFGKAYAAGHVTNGSSAIADEAAGKAHRPDGPALRVSVGR